MPRPRVPLAARLAIALLLALAAVPIAGCPEKARGRLNDPCGDNDECESGLCLEGQCLDPLGDDDGDRLLNGREGALGTNPLSVDTDGDGENDNIEAPGGEGLDFDGDGLIDARESNLATADPDRDCLPDEVDPQNNVFDQDNDALVLRWCRVVGVCGAAIEQVVAVCNRDEVGTDEAVDCDYSRVASYEDLEESSCDLLDNNCDGGTDEGLDSVTGDDTLCQAVGVCATFTGTPTASCETGTWVCSFEGAIADYEKGVELSCDGLDNDCDGETDEDFGYAEGGVELSLGDPCGLGVCAGGEVVCNEAGDGWVCSTAPSVIGTEVCDGEDNDCDGAVDEGFELNGVTVGGVCDGQGACANDRGRVECGPGGAAWCSVDMGGSEYAGSDEICNGIDDDCDGETDEDPVAEPGGPAVCPSFGVCAGAAFVYCDENDDAMCDYDQVGGYQEDETACDALDNDCDGAVDELLPKTFAGAPVPIDLGVPADRSRYAAAVAPDRGVLVLVGGDTPFWNPAVEGSASFVDTWEMVLSDGTWIPKALPPATRPEARVGAWMVYDQERGRMLLGGGAPARSGEVSGFEDVWAFDMDDLSWSRVVDDGFPNVTKGAAVVVTPDGGDAELWVLSGDRLPAGSSTALDGAYAYRAPLADPAAVARVDLAATPTPGVHAAWQADGGRIAVFGGSDGSSGWTTDLTFIAVGAGAPQVEAPTIGGAPPVAQPGAILFADPSGNGAFFFVGVRGDGGAATWFLVSDDGGATWSWQPLAQAPASQAPVRTAAVAAPVGGKVRMWLGVSPDGLLRRDAWSLDPAVKVWSKIDEVAERFPAPRRGAVSAVHPDELVWYVYGGATQTAGGYAARTDLWAYDLRARSWQPKAQAGGQRPAVVGAASVLDTDGGKLYLFGGAEIPTDGELDLQMGVDELWTLDLETFAWTPSTLSANGGPGALVGHTAVLLPDGGALVYGGYVGAEPSDGLWRFDFGTRAWTAVTPTGQAPAPRAGHISLLDEARGLVFSLGGEGGGAAIGVYDIAAGSWAEEAADVQARSTVVLGAYDPWSQEGVAITFSLDNFTADWLRLDLSTADAPAVGTWSDGPRVHAALFLAPAAYDPAGRGILVLAGTDVLDQGPHGLWRVPQACP